MKKIIFVFSLIALMVTASVCPIRAAEASPGSETAVTAKESSSAKETEEEPLASKEIPQPTAEEMSSPDGEASDAISLLEMLSDALGDYIGELFCILTFIGSMMTTFLYKKGLIPALGEGIGKISALTQAAGERAQAIQKETEETILHWMETATPILEEVRSFAEEARILKQESDAMKAGAEADRTERELLRELLRGQTEMLFGVFSAANLPQYQKEQLGSKYNALLALLNTVPTEDVSHEAKE